ncbi:MAG TPA: hypothetical protein VL463_09590 [Kofleriaceae bacterium]|nr:hypothetical protein [Kofleriaceae bacterium]
MSRPRAIAYWCVLGASVALYAVVCAMQPPEGDDWDVLFWLSRQGRGLGSLAAYARQHHTLADLASFALNAVPWLHAIVTPAVACAFMIGMVAVTTGRVPRPRDDDGWLLVLLASALVWIGAPRTGLDFYNRSYAATFLYGLTAVVWLVFVYVRARGHAAWVFVLALVAGTAMPFLLPVTLVTIWKSIRAARKRGPVPAWMWAGAIGALSGAALALTSKPYLDLKLFLGVGFEHKLYSLYLFMGETGELVTLVMVILFLQGLRARLRPSIVVTWPTAREIGIAGWGFGAGMATAWVSLLTPRWGEPSILATVAGFTIAGLALLVPVLAERGLRRAMIALGVIVHVLVAVYSIMHVVELDRWWTQRRRELASAPPGGVAHVTPYELTRETSWSLGDDLVFSHRRALLAASLGLRAIEYTTPIGGQEGTSPFVFDEVWSDGVRARLLTGDLDVALEIFEQDARARAGTGRLEVVGGLDWPERDGRRLIAARAHDGAIDQPDYGARTDRNGNMGFHADRDSLTGGVYPFTEIIEAGRSLDFTWERREFWFYPQRNARFTHLQCNLDECWVVSSRWTNLLLVY